MDKKLMVKCVFRFAMGTAGLYMVEEAQRYLVDVLKMTVNALKK